MNGKTYRVKRRAGRLLSGEVHLGHLRVVMGNLADRVGLKRRFVREESSLQQHLLSDSGDVSLRGHLEKISTKLCTVPTL